LLLDSGLHVADDTEAPAAREWMMQPLWEAPNVQYYGALVLQIFLCSSATGRGGPKSHSPPLVVI
jgi:hypothetical protein